MNSEPTTDLTAFMDRMTPVLQELEADRRRTVAAYWKTVAGLVLGTLGLGGSVFGTTWYFVARAGGDPSPAIMLTMLVMFGWLFVAAYIFRSRANRKKWDYIRRYKETVFGAACRTMFPAMSFHPSRGMSYEVFDDTELFPYESDVYTSEDRLEGEVGQTSIIAAEVSAERKRRRLGSDGIETVYEQFFHGLFIIADFHKHFHSTLRVLPRRDPPKKTGSEELVVMEDPEFESEFVVYGTDQIDARYVLSTSMLRRILDLKRKRSSDVRMAFKGSNVYMAVAHRGDWFETSLYRKATDLRPVQRFAEELHACLGVVEELNLNTRIWTKA